MSNLFFFPPQHKNISTFSRDNVYSPRRFFYQYWQQVRRPQQGKAQNYSTMRPIFHMNYYYIVRHTKKLFNFFPEWFALLWKAINLVYFFFLFAHTAKEAKKPPWSSQKKSFARGATARGEKYQQFNFLTTEKNFFSFIFTSNRSCVARSTNWNVFAIFAVQNKKEFIFPLNFVWEKMWKLFERKLREFSPHQRCAWVAKISFSEQTKFRWKISTIFLASQTIF